MARLRHRSGAIAVGLVGVTMLAWVGLAAQEQFQFVVLALDAEKHPVTDLKREEVVMSENGVENQIVKVEPFHMRVKLTIAVDNGILSRNALGHYRTGLEGLVKALPAEMEVALLSMAPQPRFVVQSTTDRTRLLRGINAFAPEEATPRFADTIVEFSKRLQDDFNKSKRFDSLPVLLLISTTAPENVSYQGQTISAALQFLTARKIKAYVAMLSTLQEATAGQQPLIAIPLAQATGGRYEALATSTRLTTLLPEFGAEIAALYQQRYSQVLVTALRQGKGPLQNPRIELTRPSLTGQVSIDGLP